MFSKEGHQTSGGLSHWGKIPRLMLQGAAHIIQQQDRNRRL